MRAYDALFSAPAHLPWGQGVETVEASLFGLYKAANGQHTYDRYAWNPSEGKPWWDDTPAQSGTLTELFNVNPFTAKGGASLDGSQPLDAALCLDNPAEIYLFQGGLVRKMSVKSAMFKVRDTDTYAQPIAQVFGSSENSPAFAFDRIRAALYSPKGGASGRIWFFDHDSTNCVSVDADTYDLGNNNNPAAINTVWKLDGLPSQLATALTTAGTPFWATTQILVTDETHHVNGQSQDKGYFGAGTDWCPFTLSTATPTMAVFTGSGGPQIFNVPAGVTAVTVELWGAGGGGGDAAADLGYGYGGAGGNGGAGAYLRDTFDVTAGGELSFFVGPPGVHTRNDRDFDKATLIAGGGGKGGYGGYRGSGAPGGRGGDGNGGGGGDGGQTNGSYGQGGSGATGTAGGQGGNGPGGSGVNGADGPAGGSGGQGGGGGGRDHGHGGYGGSGGTGDGASAGGNGWGTSAGGGGGGGSAGASSGGGGGGGGGGAQGASRRRQSTVFLPGNGTQPGCSGPGGAGTGGTGAADNRFGSGGTSGAVRISW
ncbi:hypothetical protein ACIBKX_37405 [Streptomyces sp. NPDC050658]|uniref:hypothetical protein n=1 Tax=unclassified Streptomyces TaxID=2593676 RepID=UPI003433DB57